MVPLGSREITKIKEENHSRIVLLREVNKILAGVVHLILVLPRVVMGQLPTLWGTVTLVVNLAIDLLSVPSNHLQDLVRAQ